MNWLRLLYRSPRRQPASAPRLRCRTRPHLEGLETRLAPASVFVVPLSQPADATHLHSLNEAVAAAGSRGLVTIEPGALAPVTNSGGGSPALDVNVGGLTIQGDPNVPASILTPIPVLVDAGGVTLTNLNLRSLTVSGTSIGTVVSKCLINRFTEQSGMHGLNSYTQNHFVSDGDRSSFNAFSFSGNPSGVTNDLIANNLFEGQDQVLLYVTQSTGTTIRQNTFLDRRVFIAPSFAVQITDSGTGNAPTTFANNTISCQDGWDGLDVDQDKGSSLVNILNDTIDTGGKGTGVLLLMNTGAASHFATKVEGNDFRNNAVGVDVLGDGDSCGLIDMGGADFNSHGGNNFRSFTSSSPTAITLSSSPHGTVTAEYKLFHSGTTPASVVTTNGGGVIDVTKPLTDPEAFVQALYNEVLGRTGNLSELDGWVGALNQQGQAAVVNAILRSGEALGRIVDTFYLRFLGRQADANGRSGWIGFLQHGGTEEQLEDLFLTSPEYINHINTDFVQSLYLNILGRSGDTGGLSFWNNQLQSLGLAGIAHGFTASGEGRQIVLRSTFQTFLHRTPSNAELAPLVNSTQDLLSLEALVLSSSEFFTHG